jgi:hypothetical protein
MSDQDSGALSLGMLQQQMANPIDPGQLEMLGKKAAALYAKGTSLNDAVVGVVKEAKLSPEQVKRVCEFANTNAYLQEFEKAGAVRNVTFDGPVADPSVILKELNDGSAPAVHQVDGDDYAPPEGSYKTAAAGDLLAEAFGVQEGMDKAASVRPGHSVRANAVDEIYDLKVRLEGTRDHFMSKLSSSQVLLDDVQRDFCESVEQEVINGSSLGDITRACGGAGATPFMAKHAMSIASDHLEKMGTMSKVRQANSMRKVSAAKVVNVNHPMVEKFLAFTKVATEHRKIEHAIDILDEQLAEVRPELQRRLS